jgi:3-deoxy-7-phosphoheptulonate synthase
MATTLSSSLSSHLKAGQEAAELAANRHAPQPHHGAGEDWSPSSWTTKPIKQAVVYEDHKAVEKSVSKLEHVPPLVSPHEIVKLKAELREVALGNKFLLQGGDCAELFAYCNQDAIESKIKLLVKMSLILTFGAKKNVVRIGRMAGQYAKPRSSPMEMVKGKEVPSFRGDILNGYALDERTLDPNRLVEQVWFQSLLPYMLTTR